MRLTWCPAVLSPTSPSLSKASKAACFLSAILGQLRLRSVCSSCTFTSDFVAVDTAQFLSYCYFGLLVWVSTLDKVYLKKDQTFEAQPERLTGRWLSWPR